MSNGSAFPAMGKPCVCPVGRDRPTKGGMHRIERVQVSVRFVQCQKVHPSVNPETEEE